YDIVSPPNSLYHAAVAAGTVMGRPHISGTPQEKWLQLIKDNRLSVRNVVCDMHEFGKEISDQVISGSVVPLFPNLDSFSVSFVFVDKVSDISLESLSQLPL